MYRVLICTFTKHNLSLLVLAAAICVVAFAVAAVLMHHRRNTAMARRSAWTFALGLVCGGGAWATHFVALLGYHAGFPVAYNPAWTLASVVTGVLLTWAAFAVVYKWNGRGGALLAGLLFAAAVMSLHFTGMMSVEAPARRVWDAGLLVWSCLLCAGFAILAMQLVNDARGYKAFGAVSAILLTSVLALHFTAMGALALVPDPGVTPPQRAIEGDQLAALIAVVAVAMLAVVAILALADNGLTAAKLAGADRARRMAEAALEGLVVHDGNIVLDANTPLRSMLGLHEEELIGRPLSSFVSGQALEHFVRPNQPGLPANTRIDTAQGQLDVQMHTRELGPGMFVTAIRDMSQQRRAEIAETESRAKSSFMASISHELRTPLTSITSYAELIQEVAAEQGRDTDAADAEVIVNSSRHLLRLISEILDYSKLEAGRVSVECSDFDFPKFFAQIGDTIRPLAEANGNTLDMVISPDIGVIHSDPFRLRQCLLNICSNAAKFTKDGSIAVSARQLCKDGRGGVCFEIYDTGVGMSAGVIARIFEPFHQADESIERRFGGTGLGLAITKNLLTLLGGTIAAASRAGEGSTFTLWIPTDQRTSGAEHDPHAAPRESIDNSKAAA